MGTRGLVGSTRRQWHLRDEHSTGSADVLLRLQFELRHRWHPPRAPARGGAHLPTRERFIAGSFRAPVARNTRFAAHFHHSPQPEEGLEPASSAAPDNPFGTGFSVGTPSARHSCGTRILSREPRQPLVSTRHHSDFTCCAGQSPPPHGTQPEFGRHPSCRESLHAPFPCACSISTWWIEIWLILLTALHASFSLATLKTYLPTSKCPVASADTLRALLLILAGLGVGSPVAAQNEVDLLRYSWTEGGGSLRSLAMGQSLGAVGADLSNLGGNPAGLGVYRRGDIAMNLGVAASATQTLAPRTLNPQRETHVHGQVSQAGLVLTLPALDPASLLSLFRDQANGYTPGAISETFPFTAGLAWETYLLDSVPGTTNEYISAIPEGYGVTARKEVERSGQIAETNIALASNFRNRLFLGATLVLPRVYFVESTRLTELARPDTLALYEWTYTEDLTVDGNGIQGRLGVLWAASDWLRIGASYQTPGRLSIDDTYETRMSSRFRAGETYEAASPFNSITYAVRTPARFSGSAAFLFGKFGLLSAQYDRVDHGGGVLRPRWRADRDAYDYALENETARNIYQVSHNVRIGTEWRIHSFYRLRMGVSQEMTPYSNTANTATSSTRQGVAGGFEYRTEKGHIGIAFRRLAWSEDLNLFGPDNGAFQVQRTHTLVLLGAGLRL
jgi:hypothetical protein